MPSGAWRASNNKHAVTRPPHDCRQGGIKGTVALRLFPVEGPTSLEYKKCQYHSPFLFVKCNVKFVKCNVKMLNERILQKIWIASVNVIRYFVKFDEF